MTAYITDEVEVALKLVHTRMMGLPELSIVIPARNERRNLPRLLTSLSKQDYPHLQDTRVFVGLMRESTCGISAAAMEFKVTGYLLR